MYRHNDINPDKDPGRQNRPDRLTGMTREEYYMAKLENSAFLMGVLAIPSFFLFSVTGPFLLGTLAVIFAILSKGGHLKFSPKGRRAMALGVIAIIMGLIFLVYSFRTLQTMLSDPSSRQRLSDILYRKYGLTLDEVMPALSGVPFLNDLFQ